MHDDDRIPRHVWVIVPSLILVRAERAARQCGAAEVPDDVLAEAVHVTPAANQSAHDQLARSFKATLGAVRRLRGRESQRPGELSYAQYNLLFGLASEPELSASRLAALADLSPATVTQMLDHLEQAELVTRVRSERDKRVVLVALTESGQRLIAERRAHLQPRWDAALAEFSDEQLTAAAAVLDRLGELFT